MLAEYQAQDSGIYANDSTEHLKWHENASYSFDVLNYNEEWIDDKKNETGLSEYADDNNYTSSWIDDKN